MTRSKFEFPTEWALYPDAPQDVEQYPPPDQKTKGPQVQIDDPRMASRVLTAAVSGVTAQ
jgi:hypothetical protein